MIAHRLIRHSTNSTNSTASNTGKSGGAASEKTYECDVCMKTFNKHSSWWKHKKCHTGERAYKCYICERAFSQQANLQRVNFIQIQLHFTSLRQLCLIAFSFTIILFSSDSTCSSIPGKNHMRVRFVIRDSVKRPI